MIQQPELGRIRGLFPFALTLVLLTGCGPQPAKPAAPLGAFDPYKAAEAIAPGCNIHGCCKGHGEVAFMQPDKFIICTDGKPSDICDCH